MMTPEMLRALAIGLDRLNDGDIKDRAMVKTVAQQVYRETDKVWNGRSFVDWQEVKSGFVKGPDGSGVPAWEDVKDQWRWDGGLIVPGTPVYLDEACLIFLGLIGPNPRL